MGQVSPTKHDMEVNYITKFTYNKDGNGITKEEVEVKDTLGSSVVLYFGGLKYLHVKKEMLNKVMQQRTHAVDGTFVAYVTQGNEDLVLDTMGRLINVELRNDLARTKMEIRRVARQVEQLKGIA